MFYTQTMLGTRARVAALGVIALVFTACGQTSESVAGSGLADVAAGAGRSADGAGRSADAGASPGSRSGATSAADDRARDAAGGGAGARPEGDTTGTAGPRADAVPGDPGADTGADTASTPPPARRPLAPSVLAAEPWVIAIGDVHGDLEALRGALQLANLIDEEDAWVGGQSVLVQVGDQLDRGDDERAILHLLEDLADQAWEAGGAIYTLLGNHEVMNVELDLRYVTEGGWADFADVPHDPADPLLAEYEEYQRGRVAAFRPAGPYAQLLARHNAVMQIGDTVFVHGGLLPGLAAEGLDAINASTRAWMLGEGPTPSYFHTDDDPFWSRHYSDSPDLEDCALLHQTLELLGAKRMVVAHTVQQFGITPACQDQVWRIDVGLASYYGGPTEVLAIQGDQVGVID